MKLDRLSTLLSPKNDIFEHCSHLPAFQRCTERSAYVGASRKQNNHCDRGKGEGDIVLVTVTEDIVTPESLKTYDNKVLYLLCSDNLSKRYDTKIVALRGGGGSSNKISLHCPR